MDIGLSTTIQPKNSNTDPIPETFDVSYYITTYELVSNFEILRFQKSRQTFKAHFLLDIIFINDYRINFLNVTDFLILVYFNKLFKLIIVHRFLSLNPMHSQYAYFTHKDLENITSFINDNKKGSSEDQEDKQVLKKKKTITYNIQAIERQNAKLKNINLLLKKSIDEINDEDFFERSNKNIKTINTHIDKLKKVRVENPNIEVNDILHHEKIEDNLFQFYQNEINRMKIQNIQNGRAFNRFFENETNKIKKYDSNQIKDQKLHTTNEIQLMHDLNFNIMNM